jgi:hypothetical protein
VPDDLFADLRRRLDCRDIASEGGLRVGHRKFQCPSQACPSHKHKRLTVLCDDGQTFTCQACPDVRGDVVDLIQLIWGLTKKEAMADAMCRAGLDSPGPPPPPPKRKEPERYVFGETDLSERLDALTIAEDHYDRLRRQGDRYLSELSATMTRSDQAETLKWLRVARAYLNDDRGIAPMMELPIRVGLAPTWRNGLRERLDQEGGAAMVDAGFRCGLLKESKAGWFERFKGRVFLPWHWTDGRACNAKGRAIPALTKPAGLWVDEGTGNLRQPMDFLGTNDSDVNHPPEMPKPPLPFGWTAAMGIGQTRTGGRTEALPIIIQEGELDALSAMIAGMPSIATGGTAGTAVACTKGLVKEHGRDKFAIIFDGDLAGRRAGKKLAVEFRCPWNTLPDGVDTNDVLRSQGAGGVRIVLSEALEHTRHETPTRKKKPPPTKAQPTKEDDLGMPPGWEMEDGRLCKLIPITDKEGTVVDWERKPTGIREPPVICWRGKDVIDGSVVVSLSGNVVGTGHGSEAAMARQKIKSTRTIVEALAPHGFDVDSTTAPTLVRFLTDYEHAFGERLPFRLGSKQMGWYGDTFLYGTDCYGPRSLSYIGDEVGILSALGTRGSQDEWVRGVLQPLQRYPVAVFGLYAALTAPLIRFVPGLTGYLLEYAGDSSSGKSTVSGAIASAFGDSSEDGGLRRAAVDTAASLEIYAALLCNLPLFMEDAHQLKHERAYELVMVWANGIGKGRAQMGGRSRQEPKRWASVAIMTGEGSVTSTSTFAGIAARVLSLPPPLPKPADGPADEEVLADIDSMDEARVEHYGHAARLWVQWLVDGHLQEMLDAYRLWLPRIRQAASHDGPQQRWAKYLALIVATAKKAHGVIGGDDVTDAVLEQALRYLGETPAPNQAEDIMDLCLAWVAMDVAGGVEGDTTVATEAQRKVWYRIMDDGTVCMAAAELKARLKPEGVSLVQMRKAWLARDYLAWKGDPTAVAKVTLGKGLTSCVPVVASRARAGMVSREEQTSEAEQDSIF